MLGKDPRSPLRFKLLPPKTGGELELDIFKEQLLELSEEKAYVSYPCSQKCLE